MDAPSITAIFTGIATLIAAVGAFILSWRAASNAAAAKTEAAEAKTKSELVNVKADTLLLETAKIHTLTNDAASKAASALAVANETIAGLERLNASLAPKKSELPPKSKSR